MHAVKDFLFRCDDMLLDSSTKEPDCRTNRNVEQWKCRRDFNRSVLSSACQVLSKAEFGRRILKHLAEEGFRISHDPDKLRNLQRDWSVETEPTKEIILGDAACGQEIDFTFILIEAFKEAILLTDSLEVRDISREEKTGMGFLISQLMSLYSGSNPDGCQMSSEPGAHAGPLHADQKHLLNAYGQADQADVGALDDSIRITI